jgi:hypothetical protein
MRLISDPLVPAPREVTVAALVESVAAVVCSLTISIHFSTLKYAAIGVCVAPLLLMRSQESGLLGKRWFASLVMKRADQTTQSKLIWFLIKIFMGSIVIRVLATARHPVRGFRSIPSNWYRIVLCSDIVTPLEFVPDCGPIRNVLIEHIDPNFPYIRDLTVFAIIFLGFFAVYIWAVIGILDYHDTRGEIATIRARTALIIMLSAFMLGLLFIYSFAILSVVSVVTSYIYRLSIKSTALIWLPLVYVVARTYDESISIKIFHQTAIQASRPRSRGARAGAGS